MKKRISHKVEFVERRLRMWMEEYGHPEMVNQANELPLRRDMETVLKYVRDNKVIGTQSTGNMPLKAVHEVTSHFVRPPELEYTIGNRTYRLRSEADLWPLYFQHILGEVGRLLRIAPARRWQLMSEGEKFLETAPMLQVAFLLTVWWYEVNWLVAYPFEGMGDALPPFFNLATLARLRALPVDHPIAFEEFADGLIETTGLTWTAQDSAFATVALRSSIARMVIYILSAFGALECEYREEALGKGTTSKLDAFKIIPFGKALLEAIAAVRQ